jgi:hypothetical protein
MEVSAILKRFMERSPIPVMVRALLERVLNAEQRDACFARVTQKQYTRDLVWSKNWNQLKDNNFPFLLQSRSLHFCAPSVIA